MKRITILSISGVSLVGALFAIISCSSSSTKIAAPSFRGERSFEYLKRQVAFGPRVPGSPASANCRQYLADFFLSLGSRIDTMVFIHEDKLSGKNIIMVNLIAHFYGIDSGNGDNILLAAHYDSRPRADYDRDLSRRNLPIDGANDGASGVAVLLELGNLLAQVKPRVNIDLAFLDGEDWGESGNLNEYFLGAREMVRRNIKGHYRFALIIDMIGDKDLQIFREEYSEKYYPEISNMVWKTAAQLGEKAFIDSVGYAIQDDHLSFMTIDLPSAVIIDFNYPSWHTSADTPDKCSPESLGAVGRVLTQLLYEI
jgi:glutaminyl-peptide cyclotransferase